MTKPKLTPEEVGEKLIEKTQGAKIQALRFLAMLGLALSAIAAADISGIISILPEDAAGWAMTIGLFAASAKQGVMWLGDVIDNGKTDGSFKLQALALLLAAGCLLSLPSCGSQGEITLPLPGGGTVTGKPGHYIESDYGTTGSTFGYFFPFQPDFGAGAKSGIPD